MQELIPITTNELGDRAVSGRALHDFLEIETPYMKWFIRMIDYGFTQETDFQTILSESTGGRPSTDHALTLDMAKQIAMIQRTPRGKQAREYFIEVEKRFKQSALALTDDEIVAQALQITSAKVKQLEAKVEQDRPKVEYVDAFVAVDDDVLTVRDAAQTIGIRESDLRTALSDWGWIYRKHLGQRWSESHARMIDVYEWRAYAEHADKFQLRPQHNAPRHHNGQVRQTLYVRAFALGKIADRLGLGDENLIDEVA